MKSRNTITLGLMTASILLLLVLQTLWLRNSYDKAFFDLRREMNQTFRSTVFGVRDSLFAKNIKPLDSLITPDKIQTVQVFKREGKDSLRINMKSSTVQVYVNSRGNNDSIAKALQPMARHFEKNSHEGKSFIIRLADDTIGVDTLKALLTKALTQAQLPSTVSLKQDFSTDKLMRTRFDLPNGDPTFKERQPSLYSDTLHLESVKINPLSRYTASVVNYKPYLFKEIAPQILFSFLLTIITVAAFVVLYKNWRAQQRLMELKNDFISNVTHELKTPVATVSVALEALKNFHAINDAQRTKEYLDIAQNELNRLTLMTDKILKASSFENSGVVIQKELVDLHSIILQILESMKLVFEKHHASVSFQKEGSAFSLEGSQAHLTNVIYNLIDNALKYSPSDPKLVITLLEKGDYLTLSVQDNGLGIPSEYKKKIFEKFFRVPTGDIHNIKGYGLGLSYVASVIKEHKGTIDIESEPGNGSIFQIHLPKK